MTSFQTGSSGAVKSLVLQKHINGSALQIKSQNVVRESKYVMYNGQGWCIHKERNGLEGTRAVVVKALSY